MDCNLIASGDSGWIDCTLSGQSYGMVSYRIVGHMLYVMANKLSADQLSSWNNIGSLPQGLVDIPTLGTENFVVGVAWTSSSARVIYRVLSTGIVQTMGNDRGTPFMFSLPI